MQLLRKKTDSLQRDASRAGKVAPESTNSATGSNGILIVADRKLCA
jgi:hypothetical protein